MADGRFPAVIFAWHVTESPGVRRAEEADASASRGQIAYIGFSRIGDRPYKWGRSRGSRWGEETTVQRWVCSMTAAILLAHSLLGCCWHHAHACADDCQQSGIHLAASSSASDPLGCVGESSRAWGSHHHGTHECLGAKCSYVGAPDQQRPDLLGLVSLLGSIPPGSSPPGLIDGGAEWSTAPPRAYVLSAPLYLVHQTLLI